MSIIHRYIRYLLVALSLFIALAAMISVLWTFEPTDQSRYPKCVLHSLTGLHCPGCGATRALHAMVHGRFVDAIRFNPLLIIGGTPILWLLLRQHLQMRNGRPVSSGFAWTMFWILSFYFVARNLPTPKTSWLAPPHRAVNGDR